MPNFPRSLSRVHPEGKESTLGGHRVFRFETTTTAHRFKSAVKAIGANFLIELTARDSFDEELAAFLLDQVPTSKLPPLTAESIRVIEVEFPPPQRFNRIIIVPPRVAGRFEYESKTLRRVTYWVLPAYEGEFADGTDGKAFWHQVNGKDGQHIPVVDWNRPPSRGRAIKRGS